jgi:type IV pilus assembly protein PilY1
LALTPNLHVGKHTGSKAFAQTSTGAIVEIPQPNLPIKSAKSGLTVWDEIIK